MENDERRREPRYAVEAEAAVDIPGKRRPVSAATLNLSACGVLLQFKDPVQLAIGDQVICEFKLRDCPDKALPCWGIGSIVRLDGSTVGIELAGAVTPAE